MGTQAAPTTPPPALLKPFWASFIGPPWVVALVIYAVVASVRFFTVLGPYNLQELFFLQTVAMWALPFIFLTPEGRDEIGLSSRGLKIAALFLGALVGIVCGLAFFGVGMALYGDSPNNWCISIRNYLHLDEMRGLMSALALFALYALPAIFLNPIGEEILFRGFILQAFTRRFNAVIGMAVNLILFALIYLYIHGIWHDASGYHLRVTSTVIALSLLACIGGAFTLCRTLSGSLWPAMAAHAGFNLALLAASIKEFAH